MFFRRKFIPVPTAPVAAFVHQLSEEELKQQEQFDITRPNTVFDINKLNKEDTVMIEKLKVYLAELTAKKDALINKDHTTEIEAEVIAFKEALTKKVELERAEAIAKIDSDIECITGLITRETEKEAEVTEHTEDTVTE